MLYQLSYTHHERSGPVCRLRPRCAHDHRRSHDDLTDGDVIRVAGLELRVVATPGHTSDSLSFALPADHALLTGDTVLGRGTTVVAHPDGELAAYLGSRRA